MAYIQQICEKVITPLFLLFGIIGNAASVAVLRRKRLRHSFDEVEQSATSGLVCLALSDMSFCIIGLMSVLMPSYPMELQESQVLAIIAMYYNNFKAPLLNIFLLTSTWLIIAVSVGRYLAISDPFNAKYAVTVIHKHSIQCVIFIVSILINLPQFLHFRIIHGPCYQGCYCYFRVPGLFRHIIWYYIIWHLIGTLLPLLILFYCNCHLLHQVYKSLHGVSHRYSTSKITVILVGVISLFLVLVCPSMILTFLGNVRIKKYEIYNHRIAVSVTNTLQSLNFAVNFILYSCISKQFRQIFLQLFRCRRSKITRVKTRYKLRRMEQPAR